MSKSYCISAYVCACPSAYGLRVRTFIKANSLYHILALETVGFVEVVQQPQSLILKLITSHLESLVSLTRAFPFTQYQKTKITGC